MKITKFSTYHWSFYGLKSPIFRDGNFHSTIQTIQTLIFHIIFHTFLPLFHHFDSHFPVTSWTFARVRQREVHAGWRIWTRAALRWPAEIPYRSTMVTHYGMLNIRGKRFFKGLLKVIWLVKGLIWGVAFMIIVIPS